MVVAFCADRSCESLALETCKGSFLGTKGVHIDPYGNVFSGLCSGIIVGNVEQTPLEAIWKQFDPTEKRFVKTVFDNGPTGFLGEGPGSGYEAKKYYAGKCHLCTELRKFFFDIGKYNSIIGPYDCYCQS